MGETGLRVVLTVPSLAREFGGPVDVASGLRDALRVRGVHVRLVGAGSGDGHGLPVLMSVRGTPVPHSFRSLRSFIRSANVVHILGYRDPVGTIAARIAIRATVPYVLEPCGMHRARLRSVAAKRAFDGALGRRIVDRAAFVMATSALERGELVEDGVPEDVIRVRMNGLTIPPGGLPRRGSIRARFGISMAVPLVLALGRIARKKGLVDVVQALSDLSQVHVLIVGPDSGDGTLQEIERASRAIGARVHVDTRGLWGEDKLFAYADADCFVLPSRTENFGNAAAEAAAMGVPVIVSDECGVAEVLDRTAHRVVAPGNVGDLAQAITDLIIPAARAKAVAAADGVRSKLDWAVLSKDQLGLYLDAVAR